MRKSSKAAETADSKNASYYRQQTTTGQPFRSPFAMLNLTAHDCQQQRAAVGMSDDDLERDKAIFNRVVDGYIAKHGYPDTNEKVDAYLALAFEFVIAGMRDSRYPQEHWPLVACHAALVTLKGAQDKKTFKVDAAMTNIALFAQAMMNIAWKPVRMIALESILDKSRVAIDEQGRALALRQQEIDYARPRLKAYERFETNQTRKEKRSDISKAIESYLLRHSKASADEVFDALAKQAIGNKYDFHRPRYMGYEPEIRRRDRRETVQMKMSRFRNLVSELRPKS